MWCYFAICSKVSLNDNGLILLDLAGVAVRLMLTKSI